MSNFKSNLHFNRLFLPVLVPTHSTLPTTKRDLGPTKTCSLSYLHSVVLPNSQPKQRIHVPCPFQCSMRFRGVNSQCLFGVILSVQEINEQFGLMVASVITQVSGIELMFGNATCKYVNLIVMIRIFNSVVVFDHGRSQ